MQFIRCRRFSGACLSVKKAGAAILTTWLTSPWVVEVDEPAVKVNEGGGKTNMGVGLWTIAEG